jgi:gluconolactonase
VSVLAEELGGRRFNSPNDLWMDPDGGIYFSDPRYGPADDKEMTGDHVYYITPDRASVIRVADGLVRPNGLVGTPDGRQLYIADHGAGRTYVYRRAEDGTLSDRRLFVAQGADGMTMDQMGNVYLTGDDITIYDPDGKSVGSIAVPETPSNLSFGGPDGTTLFITARTSLYAVQMNVTGQ